MSETKRDYEIGYGKPPRGRPFQNGQSGNPRGPRRKDLSALLIAALNEPVYVTIDGKRRKITECQAIVTQMVNKSAKADLGATKMLFDMMKEVEQKAGMAAPPEPAKSTPAVDRAVAPPDRGRSGRGGGRRRFRRTLLTAPLPAVGRDTALDECAGLLWHDFASFALCSFRELNPRTRFAMNWHFELIAGSSLPCAKAGSGG